MYARSKYLCPEIIQSLLETMHLERSIMKDQKTLINIQDIECKKGLLPTLKNVICQVKKI